ncbi:MAG: hypothetical protein FWJ70_08965 [Micromonosporaceae bacterium]
MTTGPEPRQTGPEPRRPVADVALRRVADAALRLAGGVVTLAGSLLVGLLMFVTTPLRVATVLGTVRVPVAVVIVVGGLAALFWYAPRATGTRWATLLPLAAWVVTVVVGLGAGDPGGALLMANDWVAVLCLFFGTVVAVVGTALALLRRPGAARVPHGEAWRPPTGPGTAGERQLPPDRSARSGPYDE